MAMEVVKSTNLDVSSMKVNEVCSVDFHGLGKRYHRGVDGLFSCKREFNI